VIPVTFLRGLAQGVGRNPEGIAGFPWAAQGFCFDSAGSLKRTVKSQNQWIEAEIQPFGLCSEWNDCRVR
jgi:hypothetical protein